jgi:hypothetical protein
MLDFSQFDIKNTLALIGGSLFDHEATARAYRDRDPSWRKTGADLTLPVVVAAVVLGTLLSLVFDTVSMYGMIDGVGMFFLTLLWVILGIVIFAFVTAFLAGTFGGVNNFNRAFAMTSLLAVVGYTGSVLATLPWIGWILSLGVAIYTLVLFYRDVPVFLDVPTDKRVVHLVATIVVVAVVNFLIALALGGGTIMERPG